MTITDTARGELMALLRTAPSMVGALEDWIGARNTVTYDRVWSQADCLLTVDEMSLSGWSARTPVSKRAGFLRGGPGGVALAYVEATFWPSLLPPWARSTLEYTNTPIGEVVMGRMRGRRETVSVREVTQFDRAGTPLCLEVRARLLARPHGRVPEAPVPLVLVRERIYSHVLEGR